MEKLLEEKKKNISSIDFFILIILLILMLDLELFGIFGDTFFRDYSIIFEGGYRLTHSQIPYQDFFIPSGPVVFYMQAFFNSIFGTNLISMAFHSFFLAAILSVFFYILLRKEFNYLMSFILSIFFFLSFNGMTFYPFYNLTPYFFFFLNIFILFIYRKKDNIPNFILVLSAVLATIGVYSKQDVGLLHMLFLLFFFLFNYKKQWRSIIYLYLLPVVVLIAGIYILLSNISGFAYWFDLGQPPHISRVFDILSPRSIWGVVTSWKFYIVLFLIFSYLYHIFKGKKDSSLSVFFKNNNSLRLVSFFMIIALTTLISQSTSGINNNSFSMGDPILIFLLYILIKENTDFLKSKGKLIVAYFLIIILLLSVNPFATYGQLLLNYKNPDLGRVSKGCYSGVLMPKASIEGLDTIRNIIGRYGEDFFSMTEYSFLYCDYNIDPPKAVPLWFDENISFFEENIPQIIQVVKSSSPKVILLQDAHRKGPRNMTERFEQEFKNFGYSRVAIVDAPASYQKTYYSLGYTKTDIIKIEKTSAPIIILVRNDLLQNSSIMYN
ncbi:Dolichyl-phosphate-mannose-protein mannosyltransferase [uncultured archaeon]|nr:Dolichyl-phosphate-mannose-protein mannosyltransferase [uncultured archaeon]